MDNNTTSVATNTSDRLGLLKSRLEVAKAFVKKPYQTMKEWIKEYEIEDFNDTATIRDKVRIGYIFRRVESDLPAIFDDQPELFIKGNGKYRQFDTYFANIYDWLWSVQNLEEVIDDAGALFILLGMAYVDSPWITKLKQVTEPVLDPKGQPVVDPTTGAPQMNTYSLPEIDQPKAKAENLFKIYFSPETKFNINLDYDNCPYYFKEHSMSKEMIKARFGKDVEVSESMYTDDYDVNDELNNVKDKQTYADDIKRARVYEYYGCLPQEMAVQGSQWSYDKEYHLFFTSNEELLAEECPYVTKPLHILGNYGLITKFFRFGEAKHLMPLVQEFEQYRTQILRHTRKMANPKPMVPLTAQVDEQAFTDPNVGRVVKYQPGDKGEKPEYLSPAQLGSEVGVGLQQVRTDLEQTSGSFALENGSGVSTVKTPRGIQTFTEAADRNTRRKKKKIARFIRELMLFQFRQCSENFKPDDPRVLEIFFGDEQPKDDPQAILQVLGDNNVLAKVDIEVESLSVNRNQMKQDSLDLLNQAITSESHFPGLVNLQEIWKDVLQNGYGKKDADRYLSSVDQIKSQGVQEFVQNIGQANPALGGQLAQMIQQPNLTAMNQPQKISESINFKDLPPEGQVQMAKQAGISISPQSAVQSQQQTQPQQPPQGGGK